MADGSHADGAKAIIADAKSFAQHAESTVSQLLVFVDKLSQLKRVNFADIESSKSGSHDDALLKQLSQALEAPARMAVAAGSLRAAAEEAMIAIRPRADEADTDEDGSELVGRVQSQLTKRIKAEAPKLAKDPDAMQQASQLRARAELFETRLAAKKAREARSAAGQDHEAEDEEDEEPVDITVFDNKKSLTCGLTKTLFVDPIRNAAEGGCSHVFSRKGISQMMAHKPYIICPFPGCQQRWVSDKYQFDASMAARVTLYQRIEEAVKAIEQDSSIDLASSRPSLARLGRATAAAGNDEDDDDEEQEEEEDEEEEEDAAPRRKTASAKRLLR